jgi:hypothetical protein
MTYSGAKVREAVDLADAGMATAGIARRLKVSRAAIRDWLQQDVDELVMRRAAVRDGPPGSPCLACPLVGAAPTAAFAYLLGLYLGDGCLSLAANGVYRLRIACCDAYPGLMAECASAVRAVLPANRVGAVACVGCTEMYSYSKHWICFFPQHAEGRKHERRIDLAGWQRTVVNDHPRQFLRGLIHSDGCRVMNRVHVRGRWYAYPRYFFSNESADIRNLFGDACDLVGVEWRPNRRNSISVARRASVALLDEFIGPKT